MKRIFLLLGCFALTTACNLGATPTPQPESTLTMALPPALKSATPTQEVIILPTASFTPIPAPPPLYFTDEFDTASPYWAFNQTGGTGTPLTVFDGTLHIDIPTADTWIFGIHEANEYSNVFLRAKVSISPSGSTGLICRYSENTGWFEYNIASDGTYSVLIGQWLAPEIAQYRPVVSDISNKIPAGGPNYEIGLFCDDNFLRLYVNDTLIRNIEVTNYGLTNGKVGITADSLREFPSTLIFEWFKVSDK